MKNYNCIFIVDNCIVKKIDFNSINLIEAKKYISQYKRKHYDKPKRVKTIVSYIKFDNTLLAEFKKEEIKPLRNF